MSEYDTDILLWSEHQAELLRRLAAGEPLNTTPDWANIVEEIESVGKSDLRSVESYLELALVHWLKINGWPKSVAVPHWRSEMCRFQGEAARRFAPSMRQHLDLSKLWRRAIKIVPETMAGEPPAAPPPTDCPFTLDELITED